MLFSQRKGLKPIKDIIQVDSMDNDLRTGLWNVLNDFYLEKARNGIWISRCPPNLASLFREIWINYFKYPIDEMNSDLRYVIETIKDHYFNKSYWNEVYDFIEFIAEAYPYEKISILFQKSCNRVLEKELSAYRFVDGKLAQISSKEEIEEIEKALDVPDEFKGVKVHLTSALDKLSNRKNPDYRNSIKESISAVEALAIIISKKPKAKLKDALEEIEKVVNLHPALKESFIKLYGYTSDASGIRHALLEEEDINFEDAKFMLVSCSAFINYLIAKIKTNN